MESPSRYWRLKKDYLHRWRGVSYSGHENGNGHNKSEDPLSQPEIYNASENPGGNGHEKSTTIIHTPSKVVKESAIQKTT